MDDTYIFNIQGNHIDARHSNIQINNFEHHHTISPLAKPADLKRSQPTNPTQVTNPIATDPLSATALKGFIEAGLLDEQLMPKGDLSNGQKGMLAHDIAIRLKMQNFWPMFEQMWGTNYLRTYYNKFCKTEKSVEFMRTLNKIE